jgi:Zn-dependent peptidase ImmA (M78 family)
MQVTRMDLDGTGSPSGLVTKILKAEPNLVIPVPIEDLARQLDINEIRDMTTDGFEGGLITDEARSGGFILVNKHARRGRRRFTIGHELGHFLMTHHKPPVGGFQCSREDMRRWSQKDQDAAFKMEVEANEFSGLMLMPPPHWRKAMAEFRDPNLGQIVVMADRFDVSKEASARSYAQYHDEAVAIVVANDGKIDKIYRKVTRFPTPTVKKGDPVPPSSLLFKKRPDLGGPSEIVETPAGPWIESEWGKALPTLYEQVFFQQGGFALIMLWAEIVDGDEDEDRAWEDKTSKQRYQERQAKWNR